MPPADAAQSREQVHFAVRTLGRSLKLLTLGTALTAWAVGTLLFVLAFVICDHWWPGGLAERTCTISGMAFLCGSAFWLLVVPGWLATRRFNQLYVARLLERAYPQTRNTIIDALQLEARDDLPGSVRDAVVGRAAEEIDGLPLGACLPRQRLRQVGYIGAGVLAVLVAYAAVAPKPVLPSIWRAFGIHVPPPTRTALADVMPLDNAVVPYGEPVEFTTHIRGRRPQSAFVRFTLDSGQSWLDGERIELTPPPESHVAEPWMAVKPGKDVHRSIRWQMVAEDAVSDIRHLYVRPRPTILDVTTHYAYPPYTNLPPTTRPGGDIDAVIGTNVSVRATTNVEGRNAILTLGRPPAEKRHGMAVTSAPAGSVIEGSVTVRRDGVYRISYADPFGSLNHDPIEYRIRARPDSPPTLSVAEPAPVLQVTPDATIAIRATAGDDFGLAQATFNWRTDSGTNESMPIDLQQHAAAGPDVRAHLQATLPANRLYALAGEPVEWWISVWDNREDQQGRPAWQRTDSAVGTLMIVTPPPVAEQPPPPAETVMPDGLADAGGPGNESAGNESGDHATGSDAQVRASDLSEPSDGSQTMNPSPPTESLMQGENRDDTGDTESRRQALRAFADAHENELQILARNLIEQERTAAAQTAPADAASSTDGSVPDDAAVAGEPSQQPEASAESEVQQSGEAPSPNNISEAQEADSDAISADGRTPADDAESAEKTISAENTVQAENTVPAENTAPSKTATDTAEAARPADSDQAHQTPGATQQGQGEREGASDGEKESTAQHDGSGQAPGQGDGQDETERGGQGEGLGEARDEGKGEGQGPSDGQGPDANAEAAEGGGSGQASGQSESGGAGDGEGQGGSGVTESATGGGPRAPSEAPVSVPDQPLDDGSQPTPPLPSPTEATAPLTPVGNVPRVIDALETALRRNEVDPGLLETLGWSADNAWQFVKDYRRTVGGGQRQISRSELPTALGEKLPPSQSPSAGEVRRAVGQSAGPIGAADANRPAMADEINRLRNADRQRVPRKLAPVLRGYYSSFGTRPAE